jgi:hypothetical protein
MRKNTETTDDSFTDIRLLGDNEGHRDKNMNMRIEHNRHRTTNFFFFFLSSELLYYYAALFDRRLPHLAAATVRSEPSRENEPETLAAENT